MLQERPWTLVEPYDLADVFVLMPPMGDIAIDHDMLGFKLLNCGEILTGTFLSPRNAPANTYKFIKIHATASRRNASSDSDACSFSDR